MAAGSGMCCRVSWAAIDAGRAIGRQGRPGRHYSERQQGEQDDDPVEPVSGTQPGHRPEDGGISQHPPRE